MPTKCRYVRPGGPRSWDNRKFESLFRWAKKRGQEKAVCDAISAAEIECGEERESKCEKERAQVRSLVRALDFAADALELSNTVITAIGIAAGAAALVARFVPAARPASIILARVQQDVQAIQSQVRASLEYAKLMSRLQGGEVPRELAHLIPG